MQVELVQPNNWGDITFKQWKQLIKLLAEAPTNPLELRLKQAAILNPHIENIDTIGKLTLPQLTQYFSTIQFLDTEPIKEPFSDFILDERKFRQVQFKDISLAQWIDAEKFSLNVEDHHQLLAIFYIQPNEYNDVIRDRVALFIDEQPCSRVFYLINQFFFIQTALDGAIKAYLEAAKQKKRELERAQKWIKRLHKWLQKRLGSIYYTE